MRETVTVTWRGAAAYYTLRNSLYNVYELVLKRYDGELADTPPSFLLLIKSGDRWIGNVEVPALTEAVGLDIERLCALEVE